MSKDFPDPMDQLDFRALFGGKRIAREITDEINERLFETLWDYLRRRSVITLQDLDAAGMPNVTLRLATVQLIFEGVRDAIQGLSSALLAALEESSDITYQQQFRLVSRVLFHDFEGDPLDFEAITSDEAQERLKNLKRDFTDPVDRGPYTHALNSMGQKVGWTFSLDLIRYARRELNKIPLNYRDLLEYWALFDSATDLASRINVDISSLESGEVAIEVIDSFLQRGRDGDRHVHCAFLEGYILGVVDGLFMTWLHWLTVGPFRSPDKHFRVARVKEATGEACRFIVTLREKHDNRLESRLADAALQLERDDLKAAVLEARAAVEEAFRVAVDLPSEAHIKYANFIDNAIELGIPLHRTAHRSLYDSLSTIVHGETDAVTPPRVRGLLSEAWFLSRQVESAFTPQLQLKMNKMRGNWLISSGRK